jgi:hypothetical protein
MLAGLMVAASDPRAACVAGFAMCRISDEATGKATERFGYPSDGRIRLQPREARNRTRLQTPHLTRLVQ